MTLNGVLTNYPLFSHRTLEDVKAWVLADAGGGGVPTGTIVMWSALSGAVPDGWQECDGSNGTPDLRGLFVCARSAGRAVDTTGGGTTYAHAGTAVASHNVTQPSAHTTVVAHTHLVNRFPTATGGSIGFTVDTSMSGTQVAIAQTTASTGDANVTHSGTAVDAHGVTQPNDHTGVEPPYYVLIYIQKMP